MTATMYPVARPASSGKICMALINAPTPASIKAKSITLIINATTQQSASLKLHFAGQQRIIYSQHL